MERMAARFVNIDHDTPLLLPPDLRDWGSPGHMVHFVMDAVKALDLSLAHTNERATGHAQYPPSMMLGLLIYCYADSTPLQDGLTIPEEIERREDRLAKLGHLSGKARRPLGQGPKRRQ
jgi:hypothetical protein